MSLDNVLYESMDMEIESVPSTAPGTARSSVTLRDELGVPDNLSPYEVGLVEKFYDGFSIIDYIWLENILKLYGHFVCVQPVFIKIQVARDHHNLSIWNYNENQMSIFDFDKMLSNCVYADKRFIVMFLQIDHVLARYCKNCVGCDECTEEDPYGHANVLIIDLEKMVAERYEPHGYTTYLVGDTNLNIQYNIIIQQILGAFWRELGYSLVFHATMAHQFETCENIRDIGYCAMFSGWYATLRLKFSHLSREELDMRLSNKFSEYEMISYIRRYAKVILNRGVELAIEYGIPFNDMHQLTEDLMEQGIFNRLMNTTVENPVDELEGLVLQPLSKPYIEDDSDSEGELEDESEDEESELRRGQRQLTALCNPEYSARSQSSARLEEQPRNTQGESRQITSPLRGSKGASGTE